MICFCVTPNFCEMEMRVSPRMTVYFTSPRVVVVGPPVVEVVLATRVFTSGSPPPRSKVRSTTATTNPTSEKSTRPVRRIPPCSRLTEARESQLELEPGVGIEPTTSALQEQNEILI